MAWLVGLPVKHTPENTACLRREQLIDADHAEKKIDRRAERCLGLDVSTTNWPLGWYPQYIVLSYSAKIRKLYEADEGGLSGSGEYSYKAADGSTILCWPGA